MILAGDVGGTNTRLAFFESQGGRPVPTVIEVFPSKDFAGLEEILPKFLAHHPQAVEAAAFGIAGPVRNGRSETPNLPWVVDASTLAATLGLEHVELVNDLEANAHGIAVLEEQDFAILHSCAGDATGNRVLISAGTGLGEAGLIYRPDGYQPFASEGGHADFAPRNETEIDLLRYLLTKFDHVSYERVLSGPGLRNVYAFFRDTGRASEPAWLAQAMEQNDPARVITEHALDGTSPLCVLALDQFVSIYGAEAGNLALKAMGTGGVYIGGGIGPKILPKLREPGFLEAFRAKGRLSRLLEAIPVRVILNDKTALLGAGRLAILSQSRTRIAGVQ
jgi:glucokinase